MESQKNLYSSKKQIEFKKAMATLEVTQLPHPKYSIDQLKFILMVSLINSYMTSYKRQISTLELKDKHHHEQLFKSFRLNKSSFYGYIQRPNAQIQQLLQATDQLNSMKKMILKHFIRMRTIANQKSFQQLRKTTNTLLLQRKFQKVDPDIPPQIENLQKAKGLNLDSFFMNDSSLAGLVKQKNRYKARKQEQIYVFSRINRSIQNFSQSNEQIVSNEIFRVLLSTLQNVKSSLDRDKNVIMSQFGQNRERVLGYLKEVKPNLKVIEQFVAEIIHTKKSFVGLRYRPPLLAKSLALALVRECELERELNEFVLMIHNVIDEIRLMMTLPGLKQTLSKKGKKFTKVIRKVMEVRYVLNYVIRETENMVLPCIKVRKCDKSHRASWHSQDKSTIKTWLNAYLKKFTPRKTHILR